MPECDEDGHDRLSLSQRHGALINKKGGYYRPGKQYASSLAETKMATRTTRSAAATSVKKDDGKGMEGGTRQSTNDGTQKVWRWECGNGKRLGGGYYDGSTSEMREEDDNDGRQGWAEVTRRRRRWGNLLGGGSAGRVMGRKS